MLQRVLALGIVLNVIVFAGPIKTQGSAKREPQWTRCPAYRYDGDVRYPYFQDSMSYFWINTLIDAFVRTRPSEVSMLWNQRSAESARALLAIADTPVVVTASRSRVCPKRFANAREALAIGLALWASSSRTGQNANDVSARLEARRAMLTAIAAVRGSRLPDDRLACSFAELAIGLLASEEGRRGWEASLREVARKYEKILPERSMMALYGLARALTQKRRGSEARDVYKVVVGKFWHDHYDWSTPHQALGQIEPRLTPSERKQLQLN